MNSISIFSQDNSLSSQNIQLTAEAYKPLENLSLKVGSDFSVTSVLNYDLIYYIILALNIIVVLAFVEERKRGFWSMVYATPNGRFNLAVKRCGILAISTTILCFVMYFALFVTSFSIYGGVSDLFRNVQSIEMFQNFVFPMSEIQFSVCICSDKCSCTISARVYDAVHRCDNAKHKSCIRRVRNNICGRISFIYLFYRHKAIWQF